MALSESIVGIVSQRLLPRKGGGRVMGMEVMLGTPTIRECVKDPERTDEIKQALMEGGVRGMRTFDQHLVQLVLDDQMTQEDAMASATSPHELKLMLMKAQYS